MTGKFLFILYRKAIFFIFKPMLQLNFDPFPELITERLLLRRVKMADAPKIFFFRSDPVILKFLSKEPAATMKEAEDFITLINNNIDKNEAIMWAITLREDPSVAIGTICFWRILNEHHRAELGYVLDPKYWGKGLMKEAILQTLEYGFSTMGLHSAEARINPDNIASASVLEATGFTREAYFKEDFFHHGKFEDTAVYSRLK
jgi:ribosomal-protein-alanine N-acetyltransferase